MSWKFWERMITLPSRYQTMWVIDLDPNYIPQIAWFFPQFGSQFKSKINLDIFECSMVVSGDLDLFQKYKVDYFMAGNGLAIARKYRGRGLAVEMLKARWAILFGFVLFARIFLIDIFLIRFLPLKETHLSGSRHSANEHQFHGSNIERLRNKSRVQIGTFNDVSSVSYAAWFWQRTI